MQLSTTVLIIEDNPDIRSILAEILETGGYTVIQARNGQEGLASLESCEPTLILLDLEMPIMSGWTFIKRLEENANRTPIVIISAQKRVSMSAIKSGFAVDYVEKPFDIDDLLLKVSKYRV